MTPYTALETLLAYLLIILTLLSISVLCGTLAGLATRWLRPRRQCSQRMRGQGLGAGDQRLGLGGEDRRETLLKLIASTERKDSR